MKNKFFQILFLIIVIVCTVICYCLLFHQYTTLFYIDITITCVAELILLSNLPILSKEKLLTLHNVYISLMLNLFAFTLLSWIVIYSLFLKNGYGLNILYIGLTCLTVIYAIAILFSSGIRTSEEKHTETKQVSQNLKVYKKSIEMTYLSCQTAIYDLPQDKKNNLLKQLRTVLDKLSTLPANKLEFQKDNVIEIEHKLDEIKTLFESVGHLRTDDLDIQTSEVAKKITMLNNYVKNFKKTL